MNAVYPFHLTQLGNGFQTYFDPFFNSFFLGDARHSFNQRLGNVHAGHFVIHKFGHAGRFQRGYASKDVNFFGQPFFPSHFHPFFETIHVVYALGLNEISTGIDFFGQPNYAIFKRIGKRIGGSANEHPGGLV